MEQKNNGLFITALLLVIIVTFPIWSSMMNPYAHPIDYGTAEEEPKRLNIQVPHPTIELPDVSFAFEVKENRLKAESVIKEVIGIKEKIDSLELQTVTVKKTSLGSYYVTGYTSWELNGSVQTASGATCHKADSIEDSFYNPTTCAADVWGGYHDFGDVLWLEDFGYFIVEDTGSAVLKKHIDLYYGLTYEDNKEALTITGYYEVFSVEYVYGTAKAGDFDIRDYTWEDLIYQEGGQG